MRRQKFYIKWRSTGPAQPRGLGGGVADDDPGRFEGMFADAICTGRVNARRTGWSFRTRELTSAGYYASLGTERNGSFI